MQALWPLLVLVCPLAMGLMMVFMMRGMHHRPDRAKSDNAESAETVAPPAEEERPMVRYVRNCTQAPVTVWALGWKLKLAGRGALGDAIALPESAFTDADLLAFLEHGLIEEVDRDTYLTCIAQASRELGDASSELLPLHGGGSER